MRYRDNAYEGDGSPADDNPSIVVPNDSKRVYLGNDWLQNQANNAGAARNLFGEDVDTGECYVYRPTYGSKQEGITVNRSSGSKIWDISYRTKAAWLAEFGVDAFGQTISLRLSLTKAMRHLTSKPSPDEVIEIGLKVLAGWISHYQTAWDERAAYINKLLDNNGGGSGLAPQTEAGGDQQ